jgi:hypothetical protein
VAKEGLKGLSGFKASIARSKVAEAERELLEATTALNETTGLVDSSLGPQLFFAERFASYQRQRTALQQKLEQANESLKKVEESCKKDAWKYSEKTAKNGVKRVNPKIQEAGEQLTAVQFEITELDGRCNDIRSFVEDQQAWEVDDEAFQALVRDGNPVVSRYEDGDYADEEEPFTALPAVTCYPPAPVLTYEEPFEPWVPPCAETYLAHLAKSELVPEAPWEPIVYDWNWNTPLGKRSYLQRVALRSL